MGCDHRYRRAEDGTEMDQFPQLGCRINPRSSFLVLAGCAPPPPRETTGAHELRYGAVRGQWGSRRSRPRRTSLPRSTRTPSAPRWRAIRFELAFPPPTARSSAATRLAEAPLNTPSSPCSIQLARASCREKEYLWVI